MKKVYIETYGCQMNVADSEVIASVMQGDGYVVTEEESEADVIFVNTCSIRENAETKVKNRLKSFHHLKRKRPGVKIGVLGCMAERLNEQLFEEDEFVDLVVGPDAYRDLPNLLDKVDDGRKMSNVILSLEETYDNIQPVRLDKKGVSAFISIMRGCNNFCAYCVVPYTRGRERSRDPESILTEARDLIQKGYKEITLLGQNVNSYHWNKKSDDAVNFPKLMELVAELDRNVRIRFSTSHPKDLSDELIETIAKTDNICNNIHLPVQSGSSTMLKRMHRNYSREWYMNRIQKIRELIPDCGLSTDIIAGYCGESEEDHKETLSLMREVGYDFAFMFKYSERSDTFAAKKYEDDVADDVKTKRLQEIIDLQQENSLKSNQADVGKEFTVLVEGTSKRSEEKLTGRNDQNKVVIFPKAHYKTGDYVKVKIYDCTAATLFGELADQ